MAASTLAFRPPKPPTYALVQAASDAWAFADGWTPQRALASHRSFIVIETRGMQAAAQAAAQRGPGLRARASVLQTALGNSIGALHVFHSQFAADRMTILFSHGAASYRVDYHVSFS